MDQGKMQTSTNEDNTRYCCRLFREDDSYNTLNQTERQFITALEKDDVPTVEQMLSSKKISLRHKIGRYPVRALIVRSLSPDMIKMAVRNYPDVFLGRSDRFIELLRCLLDAKYGRSPTYWKSTDDTIACESYTRAFEIIDLLIELHHENSSPAKLVEAVFGKRDIDSSDDVASPFTHACWKGFAEVVTKFLDLITDENREHLREEWFIRNGKFGGYSLFHFPDSLPVGLVKSIIDRLPFAKSLLNESRSVTDEHPLFTLGIFNKPDSAPIALLYVLYGGADVDSLNQRGMTPLLAAIERGDLVMVECFLRMGARTDIVDRDGRTALSIALRMSALSNARNVGWRMAEFLLAFGVDLGKEACLRKPLPANPNQDPNKESLREVLCDVRDSNTINSMARLCRKVIRRQMGPNADEKIKEGISSSELPKHLKSYLLVENEPIILARRT